MASCRFLLFISSKWRSKTSLSTLLSSSYDAVEYNKIPYALKIAKLYGYDVASQFRSFSHVQSALKLWSKVSKGSTALAILQQPLEKIAIEYLKSRFEVGSTYAVPREFAEMALTGITGASDVDADVFPTSLLWAAAAPHQVGDWGRGLPYDQPAP